MMRLLKERRPTIIVSLIDGCSYRRQVLHHGKVTPPARYEERRQTIIVTLIDISPRCICNILPAVVFEAQKNEGLISISTVVN